VCAFPINGTRRWFLLGHGAAGSEDWLQAYMEAAGRRHVELYGLLFDHGVRTLLTPIFGPDLLERGDDYTRVFIDGLARLATHPDFVDFYDERRVRVRFYGDYRQFFRPTPHAYLSELFDEAMGRTERHTGYRLFFGVCAHDPAETIVQMAVDYYAQHGCVPDKRKLVELYYGGVVGGVDFFIGFDKFCVFDIPLLVTGSEDLYFTVCPSPYLNERQLRGILYDHLYSRSRGEPEYEAMTTEDWDVMKQFYEANQGQTLGVGARRGEVWYPLAQVRLPEGLVAMRGSVGPSKANAPLIGMEY
jgi:tuberculosinol/isotuberculosinol synthase